MKDKFLEFIDILFGFRKTLVILLLYVVAVIFRLKNLIDGAQMVDLLKSASLAFLASNGFEHAMNSVNNYFDYSDMAAKQGPTNIVVQQNSMESITPSQESLEAE